MGDHMKNLKLNNDGDLELDGLKNLKMVDGIEEVRQRTRITLGTNQGEWFLNLRYGIPWIEMLSEGSSPERFRKEVLRVLNDDPAIDEIESIDLSIDRQDRKLEIEFIAIVDGEQIRERVVI